jgi:ABC-type Fe3+ transport system permease subunit
MSMIVWVMMGIAVWHFTVFVPDRFWQGIIGALIGATLGAVVFGAIVQAASGRSLGDTDLGTAAVAVPGTLIGLGVIWLIGRRQEQRRQLEA